MNKGSLSSPANDAAEVAGAHVRRTLAQLPARDAEVLRLDAWEQLTGEELAYVLGCSTAAARVRLHRARRRFATAFAAAPNQADDHDQSIEART